MMVEDSIALLFNAAAKYERRDDCLLAKALFGSLKNNMLGSMILYFYDCS